MATFKFILLAALSVFTAHVNAQAPVPTDASSHNVANPPDGFVYLGCYTDSGSARSLANQGPGDQVGPGSSMTVENCITGCNEGLYSYSIIGLEYSGEVCSRCNMSF